MSAQDDESPQRFALGLVFFLVAAIVIFAITFGIFHVKRSVTAVAPATMTVEGDDVARIAVEDGAVKFYFATGKAEVATGAQDALADVAKAVAAGQNASISGFHDATGDNQRNAELAKQRAQAVRDVLLGLGAPEERLLLQKPEQTLATGSNAEARRVEVRLQ
jgi:outer membrane protein OmpA-like peptidoglycan-associated protein